MNGKMGFRISISALILATAPTLMVPVAAYSQTAGTERRDDRRGDKNRAECRQMKRNIKQDARQDARDSKKD